MEKHQDPEAAETVQTTEPEAVDPAAICSASYRGYIHILHGEIWEQRETLDLTQSDGLTAAFAVAMAKCQGVSKRSGLTTRVMFICEPND
jgi:hypothetical protein